MAANSLEQQKLRSEIELNKAQTIEAQLEAERLRMYNLDEAADDSLSYVYADSINSVDVYHTMFDLSKMSRKHPNSAIEIVLNSPGGDVFAGFAFYDFLRELSAKGHQITTVACGMAASAAGLVLQGGDVRVCTKNSHILIHEISTLTWGPYSALKDEVEFCKRLQTRFLSILAERSTLTARQIKVKCLRRDWWLEPNEALELGFVDAVRD